MPSIFESRAMHPGLDSELDAIYAGMDQASDVATSGLGSVVAEQLAQTSPDVQLSPEARDLYDQLIEPQLEAAVSAFNTVSETLGLPPHLQTEITPELLQTELSGWLTDSKLDYVRSAIEIDPDLQFTLVASPNVLVGAPELFAAASTFGEDQPHKTWIYDKEMPGNLYASYSPEELSGASPGTGNTIQFSLIPSQPTPELASQTATQQQDTLKQLQTTNPDLKVPSVLEAITYWQTLRQQDYQLDGTDDTVNRTFIRHFNLDQRRVDDWVVVPGSFVILRGGPYLHDSYADNVGDGRLAVG